MEAEKAQLPEDVKPEVGLQLQVQNPRGEEIPVIVTEVGDKTVTLDANHPLAGETLTYDIQLLSVVD